MEKNELHRGNYKYKSASFDKKTVALSGQVVVLLGIICEVG